MMRMSSNCGVVFIGMQNSIIAHSERSMTLDIVDPGFAKLMLEPCRCKEGLFCAMSASCAVLQEADSRDCSDTEVRQALRTLFLIHDGKPSEPVMRRVTAWRSVVEAANGKTEYSRLK